MSKHPGPWTIDQLEIIRDASGEPIARLADGDPETRAVLLHAAEMWEAVKEITSVEPGSPAHRSCDKECCELVRKIESEIAKGKP